MTGRFSRSFARLRVMILGGLVTSGVALAGPGLRRSPTPPELSPSFRPGEAASNVFSISQSVVVPGYDEAVRRNGGSGDYRFTGTVDGGLRFEASFRYDGRPISNGIVLIRDEGRISCWGASCQPATDASGLLYNPAIWGTPPPHLVKGLSWRATIAQPWELGPPAVQTVTVLGVDRATGSVTLERRGEAQGPSAGAQPTLKLHSDGKETEFVVTPGRTSWRGVATFRRGVVISDELLVDRTDLMSSQGGSPINAQRRSIMLLNAAPAPTIRP